MHDFNLIALTKCRVCLVIHILNFLSLAPDTLPHIMKKKSQN